MSKARRSRRRGVLTGIGMLIACAARVPAQDAATQPTATRPAPQSAEFDDLKLLEMEIPTVVTAGRREQQVTDVPYAISVITAEDIRSSGARTVPDALRLAAGVDVAELSWGSAALSPRGLHGFISRQTLVLVDGRQIYNCWFGGALLGSWPFQLEDITRIEVIRGPAGVTWGANAVNGVINVITKDPRDQYGLTVTGAGGTRGWQREHIGYAFGDQKFRMRVSGEYEGSDGYVRGGSLFSPMDDDYRAGRMSIYGVYEPDRLTRLTFTGGHQTQDEGYMPPPTAGLFATRRPGALASYLTAKWRRELGRDNVLELTGYATDLEASNGMKAVDYCYQQLAFQVSHTFKPHRDHTVTWGFDSRADLLDSTNADPFSMTKDYVSTAILGLYVQDDWRFAEKWNLQVGGRVDYEFYGGFQPSGRIALSYDLTDNSMLFGSVSRAFQMPPAAIRFSQLPMLNGLAYTTIDRDLPAQTLIAYEIGYRGRWFSRLDVSAGVYWNDYSDLDVFEPRPGPPGLVQFKDSAGYDSAIYGFEFESKWRVTDALSLRGNYTYQLLEWRASQPFVLTDAIEPPRHKLMVGASYSPFEKLHLSAHAYWTDATMSPDASKLIGGRQIPPYWRLDLRGEYKFWKAEAGAGSLAIGVRNLLDSHHPEGATTFLNDAEVARTIYAELRLHFK